MEYEQETIYCSTCGHSWLLDDDQTTGYDAVTHAHDGAYCVGPCLDAARAAAYVDYVSNSVDEAVSEAMEDIEQADKIFKVPNLTYEQQRALPPHPYAILDDVLCRVRHGYANGRDTGWRDGAMLSSDESFDLLHFLQTEVDSAAFKLEWDAGRHPSNPVTSPSLYRDGENRKRLELVTKMLETFKAARDRTVAGTKPEKR
jgi:hypothetical protein